MRSFDGKIVLVTGTSSGVGRAAAVELARRGAHIICAARRAERGDEALADIRAVGGAGEFIRTDISDAGDLTRLFNLVERKYGRLDGAFNNAAIEIDLASLPDVSLEAFDRIFAVNVRGTFMCLQHEMRAMRERKAGAIVNVASTAGVTGLRHSSAYVASKHAIVGMSRSAALDGAEFSVRVNCICPGIVDTEMMLRWTRGDSAIKQHLANFSPMKRVAAPEEIAEAACWLLSDKASYVTGLIMAVDGGVTSGLTT
jgi:NAD(P)-dependent dehydrogenase (short-subunit alcohol dehydrogenase family)